MKRKLLVFTILLGSFLSGYTQEYFPKNNGVKSVNKNFTAFINAKIQQSSSEIVENGTLLIQNGKIIASGTDIKIPENSVIVDLQGKYIYPSFIDIFTDFGIEKPKKMTPSRRSTQYHSTREGYYWNDHIMPENNAIDKFSYDSKKAKKLQKLGFGIVNTHIPDGIVQGTGLLVALNNHATNNKRILNQKSSQHLSFKKSVTSNQSYPTSQMGAIALLKQLYHDAEWYAQGNSDQKDMSIEVLLENKELPQIFDAGDKKNGLRAAKIGNEFGIPYIIKGYGNEYERLAEVKKTKATYILPLNFPKPYDVTNSFDASKVDLASMRYWNQAPFNPGKLAQNNIVFALTTADLEKPEDFLKNLRKSVDHGLSKAKALEALTSTPAKLLKQEKSLGKLKAGFDANFLITSGDIFEENTHLYENWIQGDKHVINDMTIVDITGTYDLKVAGTIYKLVISGKPDKLNSKIILDSIKLNSKLNFNQNWLTLFYNSNKSYKNQFIRLSSLVTNQNSIEGKATLANGSKINWVATRQKDETPLKDKSKETEHLLSEFIPVSYPNKTYGWDKLPQAQPMLIKNATVWTNENTGILKNTDVLVKNGKIVAIGNSLDAGGALVIDGTGKHLTSGIIDEHSHIAATSINEAGHNSSAEVTIEDVIDPDDIDIYRNLSGGVTAIQILHGSANPIGGRSALIKLKWGESADNMIINNAPGFIKFALGENVKQSNWGSTTRFPQTRMGVEQVFIDYFQRASDYDKKWKSYNKLSSREKAKTNAPRFDIEMKTLAEILNKERFISCHSYVQSEINMLMKVAESFGFTVSTFTHILEGYKVADKMAAHGVGGSTFSDWWAYKYEVNDAIPYNAAIMHKEGVLVAINSDDAEMSRRLNQEAAKTIKYGGVSEEDAWKFVTLNPAKLLKLDKQMGSIKEGKDADLVLWSDHPLSIYAIAEKTMIDGIVYYDYKKMKEMKEQASQERNKLVNLMIAAKNKGMATKTPEKKEKKHFHCDSL
ncbi:amidohydrolase family protein [Ascidiimonas sp. W6]|uniref:amidohydrolase family protein n=1 Tax=Ascidiimonas meishanensis TaxID=3128903 RepID=UPI0030EF6AE8